MLNSHRLSFPCAFHPSDPISHFCQHKQCMLPLCKQCLTIHQKQHSGMNASANIIDIGFLVEKVNKDIQSQRETLHKKFPMLTKLQKNAEETHKSTLKKLEGDRADTIKLINSKFDEMSKALVNGYQQRAGFIKHLQDKMQTLHKALQILNETLYKSKPMRTIIMWQTQQLEKYGHDYQIKLEKQLMTPFKIQLLDLKQTRLEQALNCLTTDRLTQSNSSFQTQSSNQYFQMLSKVIQTDIDLIVSSSKRKSTNRRQKNPSEEKDRTGDIKVRKIAEVLGSIENGGERKWANRTGKMFLGAQ